VHSSGTPLKESLPLVIVYVRDQPNGAAELVGETLRCE
jgi:hypothetical protein